MRGFFLSPGVYTAPVAALFLFQMVFMDTTATIPTGAMAERWKFTSFVLFSFVISTIIYPIYANWVWGGGWLSQLGHNFGLGHGHVDFAGSSVVHMVGGVAALVGAKMMGPRIGKYDARRQGAADPRPQHPDGRARHVHPRVRLVRLQPRLDAVRDGHAHRGHRGEHDARVGGGRVRRLPLPEAALRRARRQHALQRHAGRAGRDHRAVRVRDRARGDLHRRSSPACWWSSRRCSSRTCSRSTIPSARRRCTASAAPGGSCRSGLFADGRYGDGWNGVAGPVRGLFYGDPAQFVAECIGILANVVWVGTRRPS